MPDFVKNNPPLVSIILLNYNGKNFIRQCIKSILNSSYDNFELIVVDNNSTDNSIRIVEEFVDDRIKIIKTKKNLGYAGGNNFGVKKAAGDYLVILNIDTEVDKEWLTELVKVMEQDTAIGVAQPKLLLLDDKTIFDSAGDYIDFFGAACRRGGDWFEKDHGQYDTIHDIFSARGAAIITRKKLVEEIGLFDDDYFLDYEDIDFCWRVRLYGKRVVMIPASIVYHKTGGISSKEPRLKNIHPLKNRMMTLIKNYDDENMKKYAINPILRSIFTGSFLMGPIVRSKEGPRLILGAYFWLFKHRKELQRKREHIQNRIRKVPDSEIMKYMIKTSRREMQKRAFNSLKYGKEEAKLKYFNQGYLGIRDEQESKNVFYERINIMYLIFKRIVFRWEKLNN